MHTCPDCGQACYCSGDIEDHDTGEDEGCTHYLSDDCCGDDDDFYDDYEPAGLRELVEFPELQRYEPDVLGKMIPEADGEFVKFSELEAALANTEPSVPVSLSDEDWDLAFQSFADKRGFCLDERWGTDERNPYENPDTALAYDIWLAAKDALITEARSHE